jgi:cbb3-type cytochrome oxidase subunit 3
MDLNLIRALVTLAALGAFLAIVVWAYVPRRKATLDAEARRILHDLDP